MNKYEMALKQMCLHCKTKPQYCNKKKCNRFQALKELVDEKLMYEVPKMKYNSNRGENGNDY